MTNFQTELEKLLCKTREHEKLGTVYTCGVCGEGWGSQDFDYDEATQAITTLILETLGEDYSFSDNASPTECELKILDDRNMLLKMTRTKFTNPKKDRDEQENNP
jgi:hypothetical protein